MGVGGFGALIGNIEDLDVDAVNGGLNLVVGAADVSDAFEALVDDIEGLDDDDDIGDGEQVSFGEVAASVHDECDCDGPEEFDGWAQTGDAAGSCQLGLVLPFGGFIEDATHMVFGGKGFDDAGPAEGFLAEGGDAGKVLLDLGLGVFDSASGSVDDERKDRDEKESDEAEERLHIEDKCQCADGFDGAINRIADDHNRALVDADIVADDALDFAGALAVEIRNGEAHELFEELLAEIGGESVRGFAEVVDLAPSEDIFEPEEGDDTEAGKCESAEGVVLAEFDLVFCFLNLDFGLGFIYFLGEGDGVDICFFGDFGDLVGGEVEVVTGFSGFFDC